MIAPPYLAGSTRCASNLQMTTHLTSGSAFTRPTSSPGPSAGSGGAAGLSHNHARMQQHVTIKPTMRGGQSSGSCHEIGLKPHASTQGASGSAEGNETNNDLTSSSWSRQGPSNHDVLILTPNPNPGSRSKLAMRRRAITARLRFIGVQVCIDSSRDGDEKLLLLSAPDELLEEVAERLTMEKKLKIGGYTHFTSATKRLFQPAVDASDGKPFFTSLERCRLILALLELNLAEGGVGLDLKSEIATGTITDVIPIHESHVSVTMQRLMRRWCLAPLKIRPEQPLDEIRDYFGEQIAIYFAFVQTLTSSLILPSIVGCVAVLGMLWYGTVDNPLCPLYSMFILFWIISFCKMWRREEAKLAFRWNVEDFEETERERPEFEGPKARGYYSREGHFIPIHEDDKLAAAAPIVKRMTIPERRRRMLISFGFILPVVVIIMVGVIGVLAYRSFLQLALFSSKHLHIGSLPLNIDFGQSQTSSTPWISHAKDGKHVRLPASYAATLGSVLGGICNSIFIMVTNSLYSKIAKRLNDWENHRTETDHADALIIKTVCFQFVNSYISLFYIAFIKMEEINILGVTGLVDVEYCHDLSNFLQLPEEIKKQNGGFNPYCMGELSTLLTSLVITSQIVAKVSEYVLPKLNAWLRKSAEESAMRKAGQMVTPLSFYEEQAKLEPFEGVFDEYNRIIIQIGYIVLFAPAFPIVSLICYVSFLFEIRTDAYKLLRNTQRPRYAGAQDIGSWQKVLIAIGIIGVFTNIGMIGYTSTAFSAALPLSVFGLFEVNESNKALYLILLEHLVLVVQYITLNVLPDYPEQLALTRARANWRKKATVELSKSEAGKSIQVDGSMNVRPARVDWDDDAIPERFWKERGWDDGTHEPRRHNELAKLLKAGEYKGGEEQRQKEAEAKAWRLEQAKLEQASVRLHKLEMASRRSPVKIMGSGSGPEAGSVSSRLYAIPYEATEPVSSTRRPLLATRERHATFSDDLHA